MIYVVMGVAGCGKTTVARMLSEALGVGCYEADDYHTPANVEKMRNAAPLTTEDRLPWLGRLAEEIGRWANCGGAVLACSALRKSYRDILRSGAEGKVVFIYLKGSKDLIVERMKERAGHFFPLELLDSQFEALQEPQSAITVDLDSTPEPICENVVRQICRILSE